MNEEQQLAFHRFKNGDNLFITGPAGTGKTYLINQMFRHCVNINRSCHVTALTGCAALLLKNCNARTIHSFAGLGVFIEPSQVPSKVSIIQKKYPSIYWRWRKTKTLIIDEVSMLSVKYLYCLDIAAKTIKNNNKPFGGIQVIFLGDFFQLPCVNTKEETTQLCFETDLWKNIFSDNTILLTKNMRASKDMVLSTALSQIRKGSISNAVTKILKERVISPSDIQKMGIKPIEIVPTRYLCDKINRQQMAKLDSSFVQFNAKPKYPEGCTTKLNKTAMIKEIKAIEKTGNFIPNLQLKIGSNVMLIQNLSIETGLVNGSIGRITHINNTPLMEYVTVQFKNGISQKITRHTWWNSKETFGISQIPLIPAYAITIHKIQGQTLDCVYANIGSGIFESGQSYVALSRVRSMNDLYLSKFNEKMIFAEPKVIQYYNTLSK
jgi:ATP-dependent DNA helicase PIF1